MKASSLSLQAAVLLVLVGMVWGIVMGIPQDHSAMPAHAHLTLLGWVSLFLVGILYHLLFGIFYHLHPAVDRSRVAILQVWIWIAATVVLPIGVALVHSGYQIGDLVAGVGAVAVFADIVLFGWLARRTMYIGRVIRPSVVPAEWLSANDDRSKATDLTTRSTTVERKSTSFCAMPFDFDAEGKVVFGKARQVSSESGARCLAAAMVATSPGALVFSKPEGEPPPDVVIVARYGIGADEPALAEAA